MGRCDFLGFAKGNLMEDGVLYLTGGTVNANPETSPFNTGVVILTISGGEVNVDECYEATCDGLSSTTSTVINYYVDLAGEESLLYVTRNEGCLQRCIPVHLGRHGVFRISHSAQLPEWLCCC